MNESVVFNKMKDMTVNEQRGVLVNMFAGKLMAEHKSVGSLGKMVLCLSSPLRKPIMICHYKRTSCLAKNTLLLMISLNLIELNKW